MNKEKTQTNISLEQETTFLKQNIWSESQQIL